MDMNYNLKGSQSIYSIHQRRAAGRTTLDQESEEIKDINEDGSDNPA